MSGQPQHRSYMRFSAAMCICAGIFLALNEHGSAISNGTTISESDPIRLVTVSVHSSDDDCTGVKIASNLILTAKHCIISKSTKAVFGNGSSYAIIDSFAPYSKAPHVNVERDVAVLRIDRDVPGPVAELSNNSTAPKDGAIAWTAGYGGKQITDTSNPLRKAQVVMTNANYSAFLMAIKVEKGRGVCDGDSGAPGYIEIDSKVVVWGINSASLRGSALCGFRELYAKVTLEDEWLRNIIIENRTATPSALSEPRRH